ncbi:MAG: SRPBCC family protein [Armatimonadota bacterium]
MAHVRGSILIRAPIEKVYAYLSDLPRMSDWCAPVVEARWLHRTSNIVDSKAEMVVKVAGERIPSEMVVLKADPPHHFSVRAITGVMGTYTWTLEPAPGGSLVTRTIDWALPPSILEYEIEALYFERTQKRTLDQDLENAKAVIERELEAT